MRIFKYKSQFLVLFLLTLLTACVYEPIDGTVEPDPGSNSGVFKADFGGKTWTASKTQAIVSGHLIEISATNSKGEGFAIMIEGAAVGTYAANENFVIYSPAGTEYGFWSVNEDNPTEDTGSVTITSINTETKTISGTFHFKGYWSNTNDPKVAIQFTNGTFTIPYITQEETGDVFTAKVGGTNFVSTDIFTATIGSGTDEFITIGAEDVNMNSISIGVRSSLTTGTYSITANTLSDKVQGSYEDVNGEYKAVSGSVTITSITADRIKGTFKFTTNGTTPFNITEGTFDVEY
ncbi:hypothetical protein EOD40_11720 [Flavobacterium sufflavum]|uniref:Lipoprotein n=1 Tax=Flavobacterium sufflavum TaxID=1921138 RepID=A0A3S2U1U5_9FLAO|nr:DUF6252 family protein [Flavobacterium sufflavum]RVT75420.1 hypothetical protein EOD40_11720 [Flavobacterium sufflavum]